jgi:protein-disulfide isomerase
MGKPAAASARQPSQNPDNTLKWLLIVIGVAVVFAIGRWSAGGDRLDRLEAEQQRLRDQIASGVVGPSPPAGGAATSANPVGLKTGIDLAIAGRPALGSDTAPVTFIEFSDFQCPFCGRYVRDTFPQIKRDYVDTGKVQYVFRHFPIDSLHPQAPASARAADCAHAQGRFWPMHDRLFADPADHSDVRLAGFAQAAGLAMPAFNACMSTPSRPVVLEDLDAGARGGMMGTPAFFVGTPNADGTIKVVSTVYGAKPLAAFQSAIEAALAAAARN